MSNSNSYPQYAGQQQISPQKYNPLANSNFQQSPPNPFYVQSNYFPPVNTIPPQAFDIDTSHSEDDEDDVDRVQIPETHYYNRTSLILAIDTAFYIFCLLAFINLSQVYPAWYALVGVFGAAVVWAIICLYFVC